MSHIEIPYTVEPRPETGMYNGKLGMWLFLASEIMLFGGLFSAYVLLRTGATEWPRGAELLNVPLAAVNTVILIVSSMTIISAWAAAKEGSTAGFRKFMFITIGLGALFVAIKLFEWNDKFSHDHYPSTSTFYAIYFVLTGVHLLHLVVGILVGCWHAIFGPAFMAKEPERFTNRIEVTGLYWHFVDLMWLVIFPLMYLT